MTTLIDDQHRTDLIHRLKRAEGQLRGVQQMIESGQRCQDILSQMTAVRKAVDSACVRMAVCYMGQQLQSRLELEPSDALSAVLDDMQAMLVKVT